MVTNITDTSATVTWVANKRNVGNVRVIRKSQDSETTNLPVVIFYDDNETPVSVDSGLSLLHKRRSGRLTHHVTITDLEPNRDYRFEISKGIFWQRNNRFEFSTFSSPDVIETPSPLYGLIQSDLLNDGIVLYSLSENMTENPSSQILSAIIVNGTYSIDRAYLREYEGLNFYERKEGDIQRLQYYFEQDGKIVQGGRMVPLGEEQPVSTIIHSNIDPTDGPAIRNIYSEASADETLNCNDSKFYKNGDTSLQTDCYEACKEWNKDVCSENNAGTCNDSRLNGWILCTPDTTGGVGYPGPQPQCTYGTDTYVEPTACFESCGSSWEDITDKLVPDLGCCNMERVKDSPNDNKLKQICYPDGGTSDGNQRSGEGSEGSTSAAGILDNTNETLTVNLNSQLNNREILIEVRTALLSQVFDVLVSIQVDGENIVDLDILDSNGELLFSDQIQTEKDVSIGELIERYNAINEPKSIQLTNTYRFIFTLDSDYDNEVNVVISYDIQYPDNLDANVYFSELSDTQQFIKVLQSFCGVLTANQCDQTDACALNDESVCMPRIYGQECWSISESSTNAGINACLAKLNKSTVEQYIASIVPPSNCSNASRIGLNTFTSLSETNDKIYCIDPAATGDSVEALTFDKSNKIYSLTQIPREDVSMGPVGQTGTQQQGVNQSDSDLILKSIAYDPNQEKFTFTLEYSGTYEINNFGTHWCFHQSKQCDGGDDLDVFSYSSENWAMQESNGIKVYTFFMTKSDYAKFNNNLGGETVRFEDFFKSPFYLTAEVSGNSSTKILVSNRKMVDYSSDINKYIEDTSMRGKVCFIPNLPLVQCTGYQNDSHRVILQKNICNAHTQKYDIIEFYDAESSEKCKSNEVSLIGEVVIDDRDIYCEMFSDAKKIEQCKALGDIYRSTNGPYWTYDGKSIHGQEIPGSMVPKIWFLYQRDIDDDSNSQLQSFCNWYGIECNADGEIIALNLSNVGLDGYIPSFGTFTHLQTLDLSQNNLSGDVSLSGLNNNYFPELKALKLDENLTLVGVIKQSFFDTLRTTDGLVCDLRHTHISFDGDVGEDNKNKCLIQPVDSQIYPPNNLKTLFINAHAKSSMPEINLATQRIIQPGIYTVNIGNYDTKDFEVTEDSLLSFYYDTNGNGRKDPDESYLDNATDIPKTITVTKRSDQAVYNIAYGWNLLHFPYVLRGEYTTNIQKAEDLINEFSKQGAEITHVATYRGGKFIVFTKQSLDNPDQTFGINFSILPGEGYFVKSSTNASVKIQGNQIEGAMPVELNGGWNLVGIYNGDLFDSSFAFDKLNDMVKQDIPVDVMSKYDDGLYSNIALANSVEYGTNFRISPQNAYWIRVNDTSGSIDRYNYMP